MNARNGHGGKNMHAWNVEGGRVCMRGNLYARNVKGGRNVYAWNAEGGRVSMRKVEGEAE